MRRKCLVALALLALLALSACNGSEPLNLVPKNAAGGAPRVVVAIADTAFNPYHSYFYAGSLIYPDAAPSSVTPEVLEEFDIAPENQITLTRTGDFVSDIAADAHFWSRVEPGQFYWFKGTNLIGVSFCTAPAPLKPMMEKDPHGVAVSGTLLKANPEAVVLMVEDSCADPATFEVEAKVLAHPAVDLASFSFIAVIAVNPTPLRSQATYRGVVGGGKLLFRAAGNVPFPTPIHTDPGTWWTIGVSSISSYNGQSALAGNFPDFVSLDDDDDLPNCMNCENELDVFYGTSHATPRAAGVASRVLLEARRLLDHEGGIIDRAGKPAMVAAGGRVITNWDLRRALEVAAYADYGPEDYSRRPIGPAGPQFSTNDGIPVNPLAPWLQLGWGDLTPVQEKQVIPEALAYLGLGAPTRFKVSGFCDFQAANMRLRQAYSQTSGSFDPIPDPNPYIYCDSALLRR